MLCHWSGNHWTRYRYIFGYSYGSDPCGSTNPESPEAVVHEHTAIPNVGVHPILIFCLDISWSHWDRDIINGMLWRMDPGLFHVLYGEKAALGEYHIKTPENPNNELNHS